MHIFCKPDMFKTQQSYLPIWTDGVVVVFAVEVNFVLELTTSERTSILMPLSYFLLGSGQTVYNINYMLFIRTNLPKLDTTSRHCKGKGHYFETFSSECSLEMKIITYINFSDIT